jgi:hypothetical protein
MRGTRNAYSILVRNLNSHMEDKGDIRMTLSQILRKVL